MWRIRLRCSAIHLHLQLRPASEYLCMGPGPGRRVHAGGCGPVRSVLPGPAQELVAGRRRPFATRRRRFGCQEPSEKPPRRPAVHTTRGDEDRHAAIDVGVVGDHHWCLAVRHQLYGSVRQTPRIRRVDGGVVGRCALDHQWRRPRGDRLCLRSGRTQANPDRRAAHIGRGTDWPALHRPAQKRVCLYLLRCPRGVWRRRLLSVVRHPDHRLLRREQQRQQLRHRL